MIVKVVTYIELDPADKETFERNLVTHIKDMDGVDLWTDESFTEVTEISEEQTPEGWPK